MAAIPFFLRLIAVALGLGVAQWTSDSVSFASGYSFAFSVLILGAVLTLLKPVLVLLMLPFVILTLGVGLWFVNALLVMLTSSLIPGFYLADWGSAFWSAIWVSLFTLGAMAMSGKKDQGFRRVVVHQSGFRRNGSAPGASPEQNPKKAPKKEDDDVIDI
ncbi:phage holin family protein [Puniceicoccus vermicola]|uniref:Phage holin family protein n=1 Tax=Puniceicoccus vermicola TaxID=388746 RepID=A0A7X1AV16_9BACT|nr:phage holin family protein [Puniceicoccus vermicola]MBC2600389.1 phage holin family protein [Puniceicoccus vermicola]